MILFSAVLWQYTRISTDRRQTARRQTARRHIMTIASYFHLRALRHVRSVRTEDMAKSIAVSWVSSRLDYANSVLFGTSTANLHKIQRVQNTLAKIVLNNSTLPSTIALHQLHWLPVKQRIYFKIMLPLLIVPFSQDRPHTSHHLLTLIICPDLSVLPHWVCYMFLSPPKPSVAKPLGSQLLRFGTLFHKISGYYHPLALSNAVSKLTFFPTPPCYTPAPLTRARLNLCAI